MSKIRCECGHVIVDQTDNLQYKADIIPDTALYPLFDRLDDIVDTLTDAIQNGKKKEWIDKYFDQSYPRDLSNSSMMRDLFLRHYADVSKQIYQCEGCGRILIQKDKTLSFVTFKPESDDWAGILNNPPNHKY